MTDNDPKEADAMMPMPKGPDQRLGYMAYRRKSAPTFRLG
jgi:hypothetical protein